MKTKKYRVTSAHPLLKEGTILSREEVSYKPAHSVTTSNGEPINIAFLCDLQIEAYPTWYEEVKPERWEPKEGEGFWTFDEDCIVLYVNGVDKYTLTMTRSLGYFKTKEQAEEAAKRVRACLREYQEELMKE